MTAAELNPDLRILIDERLDAIDRTLLRVEVSYSERRSIVAEVETQIFELLSRKTEHPTREDVLAVLDSLDPPESYIPEELRSRLVDAPAEPVAPQPARPVLSRRAIGMAATMIAGGVFIVGVVVGNFLMIMLAVESNGVIQWLITLAALLYLNYRALPRLWNWYSKRRRTIAEDIRTGLSGWLVPESGAQTS
jgi:hypothetical protein